jgi:lipopolysaccharide export system protein LptA
MLKAYMYPANKKIRNGSALRASVGSGKSGPALRSHRSPLTTYHSLLLLLAMIFFYTPSSFAERADNEKPMHLEADQMLVDDAKQISTFTGNVQFIQGTLLIRGDKIIVVQDKEGYKHGTAYGNTASFRQKREGLDEYVEGYGERIEYDMRTETVDFYVRASVKRALDEVRGEHITYNAKTEIFHVNSGIKPPGGTPSKRVHAILQPKPKQPEAAPADVLPIKPSTTLIPAEQR